MTDEPQQLQVPEDYCMGRYPVILIFTICNYMNLNLDELEKKKKEET